MPGMASPGEGRGAGMARALLAASPAMARGLLAERPGEAVQDLRRVFASLSLASKVGPELSCAAAFTPI